MLWPKVTPVDPLTASCCKAHGIHRRSRGEVELHLFINQRSNGELTARSCTSRISNFTGNLIVSVAASKSQILAYLPEGHRTCHTTSSCRRCTRPSRPRVGKFVTRRSPCGSKLPYPFTLLSCSRPSVHLPFPPKNLGICNMLRCTRRILRLNTSDSRSSSVAAPGASCTRTSPAAIVKSSNSLLTSWI